MSGGLPREERRPKSNLAGDNTDCCPPLSCVLLQYIATLLLSSSSSLPAVDVNGLLPRKEESRSVGAGTCTTGSRDGVSKRYVTFDSGRRGDGGKRPPSASAAPSCPTHRTSTRSVLLSLITMPPSPKNANHWKRWVGISRSAKCHLQASMQAFPPLECTFPRQRPVLGVSAAGPAMGRTHVQGRLEQKENHEKSPEERKAERMRRHIKG